MSRAISKRLLPHTVTLYNFVSTGVYSVVTLKNVYVEHKKNANISTLGSSNANITLMIIDCINTTAFNRYGAPLSYLSPKQWQESTDKDNYWTLQDSSKDIFVLGEIDNVLDNCNINTVKSKYQAYAIKSIDTFYNTGSDKMHHFEVSGV